MQIYSSQGENSKLVSIRDTAVQIGTTALFHLLIMISKQDNKQVVSIKQEKSRRMMMMMMLLRNCKLAFFKKAQKKVVS